MCERLYAEICSIDTPKTHTGMRWVWHLGGLSVREPARRVWNEIDKDEVPGRAAQLSFYFLLALFPLLIFVSAVLGQMFSGNADLYEELFVLSSYGNAACSVHAGANDT